MCARPPLAVWKNLESATPLGHVEGTMFPSSFSHIASNYAAGYYGYMWSEVIGLDLLSASICVAERRRSEASRQVIATPEWLPAGSGRARRDPEDDRPGTPDRPWPLMPGCC